jgi:hypothetical protein
VPPGRAWFRDRRQSDPVESIAAVQAKIMHVRTRITTGRGQPASRPERRARRSNCVGKPDQAQEARYSVFAVTSILHHGASRVVPARRQVSCPWGETGVRRPIEQLPGRVHSLDLEQYFAGNRLNPYSSKLISASPTTKVLIVGEMFSIAWGCALNGDSSYPA